MTGRARPYLAVLSVRLRFVTWLPLGWGIKIQGGISCSSKISLDASQDGRALV